MWIILISVKLKEKLFNWKKKSRLQNLDRVKVNAFDAVEVEELKKIAEDFETRILPVKGGEKVRKRAESRGRSANSVKLKLLCLSFEHLANCPRRAWPAYPIRIKTLRLKTIEWKRWEKTNEIHADCTWLRKITANLPRSNFPPFRLLPPLTFSFLFSFFSSFLKSKETRNRVD